MLIRIALIVAILAGLAAAGINFVQVKQKIETTISERDQNAKDRDTEKGLKVKALKDASDTHAALTKTTAELATTKSARDQAEAKATTAENRAAAATQSEAKIKTELDRTQNELATWRTLGIPVEQIRTTLASLKTLTEEKAAIEAEQKVLLAKYNQVRDKLNAILIPDYIVELPEGLKGKVMVVDPKYDFVLLDIGLKQGAKEDGQMLVNRNGRLVAKLRIQSVQSDYCIANVMPGWKLGDIMEGDLVLRR